MKLCDVCVCFPEKLTRENETQDNTHTHTSDGPMKQQEKVQFILHRV